MRTSKKATILLLSLFFYSSCSPKLKIPSSKLEDYVELGKSSNEDLGTKILINSNNVRIIGSSTKMIDEKVKIVLLDESTKDKITVIFEEGSELKFDLLMKTRIDEFSIHPKFEKIDITSTKPIKFKHNKKGLLELSSIKKNSSEDISLDFASLSILNIILYVFDHHILTPSDNKYKFNKSVSKLPDLIFDRVEFNFNEMELIQDGYTLNLNQPFSVNLNKLTVKENLEFVNIGDIDLKLIESSLHTDDIDFLLGEGQLQLTKHQLKINHDGYSIIKSDDGIAKLVLKKGSISGVSNSLSEGKFKNLKFDLNNYTELRI